MIYREIGKTGIKVSVVGFGGMRFFKSDEETALATVRRCVDVGINFFETGSYGDGEAEIGIGAEKPPAGAPEAASLKSKKKLPRSIKKMDMQY